MYFLCWPVQWMQWIMVLTHSKHSCTRRLCRHTNATMKIVFCLIVAMFLGVAADPSLTARLEMAEAMLSVHQGIISKQEQTIRELNLQVETLDLKLRDYSLRIDDAILVSLLVHNGWDIHLYTSICKLFISLFYDRKANNLYSFSCFNTKGMCLCRMTE